MIAASSSSDAFAPRRRVQRGAGSVTFDSRRSEVRRTGVKSIDWLTYPIVDITEAPPIIDVVC